MANVLSIELPDLPGMLADIAAATSEATALIFASEFGGRQLYIPTPDRLQANHKIAQAVGMDAAHAIARLDFAGAAILVPMGPTADAWEKRRHIVRMLQDGVSQQSAARMASVHIRTVERVARMMRCDDNSQGRLF